MAKKASASSQHLAHVAAMYSSPKPAVKAHLLLVALGLLPFALPSLLPANLLIVLTASLCVYAGSWRSIKPLPPVEYMTKKDVMRFPLLGSAALLSLFLAFKFLPKAWVNAMLTVYIGVFATFVLAEAVAPYLTDFFPETMRQKSVTLPVLRVPFLLDTQEPKPITLPQIVLGAFSAAFMIWYCVKKAAVANNALGLAFALEALEQLSLGSTQNGCILMAGLFVYDVFWVFATPVMVSVAQNFDAPVKLLFPRVVDEAGKRPFAMLGLGDIVIPGIFVALMLRKDAGLGFRSSYFQSAFGGYVLGLATTIGVMSVFKAAQPALLYIVPAVLGCVFLHAYLRGEVKEVYAFSEEAAIEEAREAREAEEKARGEQGPDPCSEEATQAERAKEK